jgi:hypothetical protein
MQVWANGGGTQSAAIAALIELGRLPKPDLAIMADTEREKSETWAYMDAVIRPSLIRSGVELAIVPKSEFATCDLYSTNGKRILLPGFTNLNDVGKLTGYCSGEWKREVIARYLRSLGVELCTVWFGISLDEIKRVRTPRNGWMKHSYPLIFDVPMRRQDCIALVCDEMGWPMPPRSSCWMCPNMGDSEWRDMKQHWPDDFARAVAVEAELRTKDEHFYLHRSCKPLAEVDFTNFQTSLPGCDSGYCFV